MLDRRGGDFAETVRQCTEWIAGKNGFRTADVPEAAFDPLYSTWYAYLQDVHAGELEEEARLAAALGMKTMILDDGWQKVDIGKPMGMVSVAKGISRLKVPASGYAKVEW